MIGHHTSVVYPSTTNNRMELLAAIHVLIYCIALKRPAKIFCDSRYVVQGINSWAAKWILSGVSGRINGDLWQILIRIKKVVSVTFVWVKGHSFDVGNRIAHSLCFEKLKSGV